MNAVLIVLISVSLGGLFLFLITFTIVACVRTIAKRSMDNDLKLKLIERGLSVREIERLCDCELDVDEDELDEIYRKPRPPGKIGDRCEAWFGKSVSRQACSKVRNFDPHRDGS